MLRRNNRRRFLKTAAGLFVPAWFGIVRAQEMIMPGPIMRTMTTAAQSYLVEENCEGTGTPSGWTDAAAGGTIDWDDATAYQGSQSLKFTYASSLQTTTYDLLADYSELYCYCTFQIASASGTTRTFFNLLDSGSTARLYCARYATTALLYLVCGANNASSVTALSTGATWHHLWVHYIASGTSSAAFSTDGVRPTTGDNFTSVTNPSSASIRYLRLSNQVINMRFDRILANTSQIGDNP